MVRVPKPREIVWENSDISWDFPLLMTLAFLPYGKKKKFFFNLLWKFLRTIVGSWVRWISLLAQDLLLGPSRCTDWRGRTAPPVSKMGWGVAEWLLQLLQLETTMTSFLLGQTLSPREFLFLTASWLLLPLRAHGLVEDSITEACLEGGQCTIRVGRVRAFVIDFKRT